MQGLDQLRRKIDEIDEKFLKLLNQRAKLAVKVGKEKSRQNDAGHFHVPHREREIIERLIENNPGPFPDSGVERVFREVFSATLALEKPLGVAYLGPESTFSHQAAVRAFGHSAQFLPQSNIAGIFAQVEKGNADYGVVPIENSTEGVVSQTLDAFYDSPLLIMDEIKLVINLYLMSKSGDAKKAKKIYSHPQPFAQCRSWLNRNLPGVEQVPAASTGDAAKRASREAQSAAIAGQIAAENYNLKIIASKIEDQKENYTRFLVIGLDRAKKAKRNKTSLMFSIRDEAGSLLHALELFAKNKINMTKIQSRPLRDRAWEYLFFVDIDGHRDDKAMARVLAALEKESQFLKMLGSYPRKV